MAKTATNSPYTPTPPIISQPRGMRSPRAAISTELASAPTPMEVSSSPCPLAPTPSTSRANTGNSVLNGMINKDAQITTSNPVRTSTFCQLNFQPSTML